MNNQCCNSLIQLIYIYFFTKNLNVLFSDYKRVRNRNKIGYKMKSTFKIEWSVFEDLNR